MGYPASDCESDAGYCTSGEFRVSLIAITPRSTNSEW